MADAQLLVVEDMLALVGQTPLVHIRRLGRDRPRAEVWAKMEQSNPGGSVKDRIAGAMLDAAARAGQLTGGGLVVEPTSGNTGISLAIACAVRGYRCVLTMPESMSLERRQLLQALGAEVILTPESEQMDGAVARARQVAAERGASLAGQFDNPANPDAHARTTALEILEGMAGLTIDAVVAGVGTGGTITGVARVLRERPLAREGGRPRMVAVEPEASATLSRGERGPTKIQGLAAGFVPANYEGARVDEVRTATDAQAWQTKQDLARHEGLLVGISSGAVVHAALEVARGLRPDANVVTFLCDTGERYFSLSEYFPVDKP